MSMGKKKISKKNLKRHANYHLQALHRALLVSKNPEQTAYVKGHINVWETIIKTYELDKIELAE